MSCQARARIAERRTTWREIVAGPCAVLATVIDHLDGYANRGAFLAPHETRPKMDYAPSG